MNDYSVDVEKSLIGAYLIYEESVVETDPKPDWFYLDEHKKIVEGVLAVGSDIILVEQWLMDRYELRVVLSDFVADATTRYGEYIEFIKKKFDTREIRKKLTEIINKGWDADEMLDGINSLTLAQVGEVKAQRADIVLDQKDEIEGGSLIMYGNDKLDTFYKDANKSGMVEITIADSGHGKTQYAMFKVGHVLSMGMKVLWVQLEGKDYHTAEYYKHHKNLENLYIVDSVYDIEKIKMEAKRIKSTVGLDYMVIDYVQNVESSEKDRTQSIEYISQQLTKLAKECDCFMHVNSQVTINYSTRSGWKQEPSYGDVRWSQQLKQDAHIITSVFRPSRVDGLRVGGSSGVDIVDFKGEHQHYNSVYVRQCKVRHGQEMWDRLHLVHTDDGLTDNITENMAW